jgi:hypothetical protein
MDIDASIREFMGIDHVEAVILSRSLSGDYRTTPKALNYTESFEMMLDVLTKAEVSNIELWTNAEGWNANLMFGDDTFIAKRQPSASIALSLAFYRYLNKENTCSVPESDLSEIPPHAELQ